MCNFKSIIFILVMLSLLANVAGLRAETNTSQAVNPPLLTVEVTPVIAAVGTLVQLRVEARGSGHPDGPATASVAAQLPDASTVNLVQVETGTVGVWSGSWTVPSGQPHGPGTVKFTGVDALGNSGTGTVSLFIDTVPPSAPIPTAPLGTSYTNIDTFVASGTAAPNDSVILYLNSTAVVTTTASTSGQYSATLSLTEGENKINARARDVAGNLSGSSLTGTVIRDTIAPLISAWSTPSPAPMSVDTFLYAMITDTNPIDTSNVLVVVDGNSPVQMSLVNGVWQRLILSGLPEGLHVLQLSAVDVAGNTGITTTTHLVDGTAPDGELTVIPSENQFTIMWNVTDLLSGLQQCVIELSEGDATWVSISNSCAGEIQQPRVAATDYQVRLTAIDAVGNTYTDSADVAALPQLQVNIYLPTILRDQ